VIYLGPYGSRESREKYARLVAEWLERNEEPRCRSTLTVEQLALVFLDFAKSYYVKNGETTDQIHKIRAGLRALIHQYRGEAVSDFSPRKLKRLHQVLIDRELSRTYINDLIGVIKRCFKWGASEELVPVRVYEGLKTVDGLRKGRSAARETEAVQPVSRGDVEAVLPHVSKQIRAMIELQLLTGMRPGEVLILRPCDVTMRTDGVWSYRPQSHKTEHHDQDRVIFMGERAQAILSPWLDRDPHAFCFQPAESDLAKNRRRTARRYRRDSYALAIRRACERARVKSWSPNQLRHTQATLVREQFGLEAAQVILGHSRADVTQVYAVRNQKLAAEVVARIG
jgi:integrase